MRWTTGEVPLTRCPTRRRSTCPSSGPCRSPASAPSRGRLSRRPALRGRQAPNAVPFAYLDARHRCRVVEASKPYPVQMSQNVIYLIVKFSEAQQPPDKSRLSLSLGNKTVALSIGNHINSFQIVLIIISPVKRKISQSCHLAYMLIKFFTSFVIKQCFL